MRKVPTVLSLLLILAAGSLTTIQACFAHTDWLEDSEREPAPADQYFKDATAKFSAEISKQDKSLTRSPYSRSSQAINWALSQSNFGLAQQLISDQLNKYPDDPYLHIALGQVLLKKNELKKAGIEIRMTLSPDVSPEVRARKLPPQEQKFSSNCVPETY